MFIAIFIMRQGSLTNLLALQLLRTCSENVRFWWKNIEISLLVFSKLESYSGPWHIKFRPPFQVFIDAIRVEA